MISSTDHITAKTGITPTVNLSKAGAAFGAAGGAVTEISNGWYKVALSTTDTNTLGDLVYYITGTGADDTDFSDQVSVRISDDLAYPATSGRSMVVDAAGLVDSNMVKAGASGAGNTITTSGGVTLPAATLASTTNITSASGVTLNNGAHTITSLTATAGVTITQSTGNASGLSITGNGTGHGVLVTSGSGVTGDGMRAVSAATNGNGITGVKTGTGSDLNCTVTPLTLAKTTNITGFNDIAATAIVSSGAITTSGGAVSTVTTTTTATNVTTVNGLAANVITAAATAADFGTEIAAAVWQDTIAGDFTVASSIGKSLYTGNVAPGGTNGLMISGTNSGTTTLGALTVTGATTLTGNMVLSDGLTISAPSTLNRAGVTVTGNGTGAALSLAAGATGNGISVTTTSGNGISILPTAGHGIVATGNGTSKHGAIITGGTAGTSDGISAVAGTGGVDIRGNITGNLVGTVSTLTTYTGNTPQTGDSFARIGAAGAGLTNIGTIATCTNLTNAPTNGDFTATMKTSITTAATAATPTAAAVTGAVGSVTGSVGSVTGNVGGNVVGSVASVTARVTANTDQIAGVATSATRLARSTQGIVVGTVGAASSTTSVVTSSLDPAAAAADQYKGRIVTFDQGTTTANLRGQSTDITANTALGVLTVTALTTAPASGDTFTIT